MQSSKEELLPYTASDSNGIPLFSEKVVARVTATLTGCCLLSSDGTKYPVHKAKLQEQFSVLRDLLTRVAPVPELPLHEDATTVILLIGGMYDAHCIVNWSNVKLLLELARKFDVQDIQQNCEGFIYCEPLSIINLPWHMDVACTFGMAAEVERCQQFIATASNFKELARVHGEDWCKDLPGAVVTEMMNRRLRSVESSCAAMLHTTNRKALKRLLDKECHYRRLLNHARKVQMDKSL